MIIKHVRIWTDFGDNTLNFVACSQVQLNVRQPPLQSLDFTGPRVLDTHEHYNKRQTGVGTNKIQKQKIFQQIHHFDFAEICFCPPQTPS